MTALLEIRPLLLLAGALQGLFVATLCAVPGAGCARARRILAVVTFLISVQLLESTLAMLDLYDRWPHLLFVTRPTGFLIAPLIWLYARSVATPAVRFQARDLLHLIPAAVVAVRLAPLYALPAEAKRTIFRATFDATQGPQPEYVAGWTAYVALMAGYSLSAMARLRPRAGEAGPRVARLRLLIGGFLIHVALGTATVAVIQVTGRYSPMLDYLSLCALSVFVYAIAWSAVRNPAALFAANARPGEVAASESPPPEPASSGASPRYATSALAPGDRRRILDSLADAMASHAPHRNGNLRLQDLARLVRAPAHQVSEALNLEAGVNFYEFVNGYRVRDAQERLRDRRNGETILDIAFDVGFNSKKSFNAAFKKVTGMTPSAFARLAGG